MAKNKFDTTKILGGLFVIIIVALLYFSRHFFIAASVNGQPIYRTTLISEIEKQFGRQILDSLTSERLILQEAKIKKIEISEKEINDEILKIEKNVASQGQKLDQLLTAQKMTKEKLKEQIRIQKIVEKILGPSLNVTDKEINDFIEANKQSIPEGTNRDEVRRTVIAQLKQGKLTEKFQSLIQELKKKAKIEYFTSY